VKVLLGAVGLVLSVGVCAFAPMVRYEVAAAGARFGAQVNVERVWPMWRGVRLRGVDVAIADVPAAAVHVDEVEVVFGAGGKHIAVRGGQIQATGPRDVLVAQVEAWREKIARPAAPEGQAASSASRDELDVGGFSLKWQDRAESPQEAVTATGVRLDREADRIEVTAETAVVQEGPAEVSVRQGHLRVHKVGAAYRLDELSLGALDGSFVLEPPDEAAAKTASAPAGSASSAVSAVPAASASAAVAKGHGAAGHGAAVHGAADGGPTWEGRVQRVADSLVVSAKSVDALLEDGAKVAIERVHAEIKRRGDVLHVGPGRLSVARDGGRLSVELAPWVDAATEKPPGGAEQQALTFRLLVPVRDDAVSQEIVGDVKGGPIWLSTLGIKEGDFGLLDVKSASLSMNAHVALSGDHRDLRIEGDGRVAHVSLASKALSDEPLAGMDLAWRAKASIGLDRRRVEVAEGELDLGQVRLLGSGTYERTGDDHRVRASIELPLVGCQAALDSMPKGLVSRIAGMRMAGTLSLKGKIAFDTARIDRDFQASWDTAVSCRVTEAPPSIDVSRFSHAFERTVYTPEGLPRTLETGPGTESWVPYGAISKFMTTAVLTTEDGGFYRHRGFDAEAIRNSIRENLKKRKFVRGASTISMQLAKNVYLDRAKNLSRKLQEAVLTMYLEQALTKDQIMELYLNVIEFGPMVYGVGPAAQYYFHADAGQLSLGQALYLSSIMPSPKVDHFLPQGAVRPSWMAYLHKLMELAHKRDRVTDEELEDGLRETVVRGSPAPLRAPKPADTTGGDSATAPVDGPDEQGWTAP
jgi:hypothetical protein